MKEKSKNLLNIILTSVLFVMFGVYTYLVKTIDVAPIGVLKNKVGFSTINGWFQGLIGKNMTIYKITEYLGYALLLIVVIFGVMGLVQLIKRKSLKKVDKEILALGVLYVCMAIVYVLFEKVIINYRPILIGGELEASYPSSHTVLSICVGISFWMISSKYFGKFTKLVNFVVLSLLTLVIAGRIISGVHWLTDILGGIIVSVALISLYNTLISYKKTKKK